MAALHRTNLSPAVCFAGQNERMNDVIDWLLDADPSIRWQVMRDLTNEDEDVIAAERSRVATEGWGARLLALQAPDGLWGGRPWSQDWTDTFHVLELLRRFGLDPDNNVFGLISAVMSDGTTGMGGGAN